MKGEAKVHRARANDDHQFDIVTLRIWKGNTHSSVWRTSNDTLDGSVSQWVSYFRKCLFTLTNAHKPNQYKWDQQSLDINLGTIAFWAFDFFIALVRVFISRIFIILGFMQSCVLKNTTFHECSKIFISLYFKANFIRLSLHSCMFKNTTFHEWGFS